MQTNFSGSGAAGAVVAAGFVDVFDFAMLSLRGYRARRGWRGSHVSRRTAASRRRVFNSIITTSPMWVMRFGVCDYSFAPGSVMTLPLARSQARHMYQLA